MFAYVLCCMKARIKRVRYTKPSCSVGINDAGTNKTTGGVS